MDHIGGPAGEPKFSLPDGASQFNIRGWQGRWRQYCADGLVFYGCDVAVWDLAGKAWIRRPIEPRQAASSQAGDLPSAGFTGCMPAFTSA
jgi:hypothetical protein